MTEIILASGSPRRKDILEKMGVKFSVEPSNYIEVFDETRSPVEVAKELALGKARDVAKNHKDAVIIGSDLIISFNGQQIGKPSNVEETRAMQEAFAGHENAVTTAVAIIDQRTGTEIVDADTAIVHFKQNSPEIHELREEYLATGDWEGKAGGYGIQSGADVLIEKIEGNIDTVIGLPSKLTAWILNQVGIEAHEVIEDSPLQKLSSEHL